MAVKKGEKQVKEKKNNNRSGKCILSKTLLAEVKGENIDIAEIDFQEIKTDKQKLFLFYYSYPDSETYQNGAASARKAGYKSDNDRVIANRLLHSKSLQELSNKIQQKYLDIDIKEAYHKAIKKIKFIENMHITDYYNFLDMYDEEGNLYTRISPKKPEELTSEQLEVIEMIDWTTRGIPKYIFPSKEKARQFIISTYEKEYGDKDKNEFDVTLTLEGIKDQVATKVTVIKKNNERSEFIKDSGYIADSTDYEEEE